MPPWGSRPHGLLDAPAVSRGHGFIERTPLTANGSAMCRNIKTLFNFEPPATELEIRDASLQFVRKLSGFSVPSQGNEAAFERAVQEVAASARVLIGSLATTAEPRNREVESAKARARSAIRFGA
jgi:hypothetical protein